MPEGFPCAAFMKERRGKKQILDVYGLL